jgi:hypothetical protein
LSDDKKCYWCGSDCDCTLSGSRHKYKYRENNLYLGIFDEDGELKAVDFTLTGEKINFETIAGTRWINKLIALIIALGGDHEDILGTALESSFQKGDIPGRFIEAMEEVEKTGRLTINHG